MSKAWNKAFKKSLEVKQVRQFACKKAGSVPHGCENR